MPTSDGFTELVGVVVHSEGEVPVPEIQGVLPKYLQIAAHIRDQVIRGDLRPGDDVPSEREIAAAWMVARPTAARALEALRAQGLVESRRGSGTYVLETGGSPRARERYERARDLGSMYSPGESVEFLATDLTPGPQHVLEALRLSGRSDVVRRRRLLRAHDGQPTELSTSWYAPHLAERAPRLLEPVRLLGGTAQYIAEMTGQEATYARDQVTARLATSVERGLLALVQPAAVLVNRLTVYDATDEPVQFDEAVHPPDRWAFSQEYPLAWAASHPNGRCARAPLGAGTRSGRFGGGGGERLPRSGGPGVHVAVYRHEHGHGHGTNGHRAPYRLVAEWVGDDRRRS